MDLGGVTAKLIAKVQYWLGPLMEHTTFDTESMGILLCLHLFQQHINNLNAQNCSISLDGKSIIQATQKPKVGTGQQIIEEIHRVARRMAKDADTDKIVTLAWVPGHLGLWGNELADKEAKEAIKSRSSGEQSLPPFLRNSLLASISAVRQNYHKVLATQITMAKTTRRLPILPTLHVYWWQRDQIEVLQRDSKTKRKTNQSPSTALLHTHPPKPPSPPYSQIGNTLLPTLQGKLIPESVKHFILDCPAYAREGTWMRRKLGRSAYSIKALMTQGNSMKALLGYVGRTGRLKSIFGDVSPT